MKTTIEISDSLLLAAKERAAKEGTTLRALVELGLHRVLEDADHREPFKLRQVGFEGRGLTPEFRDAGWEKIRDAIYEGHGAWIAVDTNVLVHAHRIESVLQSAALGRLRELAEGAAPWAIPWQCIHEFIAVVTHPRIFDPPTPLATALGDVEAWLESPRLVLLTEGPGYWGVFKDLLARGSVVGPRVHDARIAAVCLATGVQELWTLDRDFSRFPALRTRNPLHA